MDYVTGVAFSCPKRRQSSILFSFMKNFKQFCTQTLPLSICAVQHIYHADWCLNAARRQYVIDILQKHSIGCQSFLFLYETTVALHLSPVTRSYTNIKNYCCTLSQLSTKMLIEPYGWGYNKYFFCNGNGYMPEFRIYPCLDLTNILALWDVWLCMTLCNL